MFRYNIFKYALFFNTKKTLINNQAKPKTPVMLGLKQASSDIKKTKIVSRDVEHSIEKKFFQMKPYLKTKPFMSEIQRES